MTTYNLTCEAVEATLPDYLDETLEPWLRQSIDEHLAECERCAAVARDMRNMEREAAALPALVPHHDLWPEVAYGIGAAIITSESVPESETLMASIEPPVLATVSLAIDEPSIPTSEPSVPTNEESVPISEPPVPTIEASVPMSEPSVSTIEASVPTSESPLPTSEASVPITELSVPISEPAPPTREPPVPASEPLLRSAEAPVPITAPVIALAERRQKRRGPAWMGLAAAALVLVTAGTTFLLTVRFGPARTPYLATDTATRRLSSSLTPPAQQGIPAPSEGSEQIAAPTLPPRPLTVATTSVAEVTRSPDEVVYDKEINMLQAMTRRRKTELDASTAAVIERNLRIIDSNIAQIRAALQKDPGSPLLGDQVARALDMKVELLRRVAMLRSNT
jgi:hypothetical protein